MADSYYLFSFEVLQKTTKRNAESLVLFQGNKLFGHCSRVHCFLRHIFQEVILQWTHSYDFQWQKIAPIVQLQATEHNIKPLWLANRKVCHSIFWRKTTTTTTTTTITVRGWWFQPIWKILVKLDHFPRVRGENKKYLSCHHPGSCHPFLSFTIPKAPSSLPSNERPSLTTSSNVEALRRSPQRKSARNSGRPEACALEHKVPEEVTGFPKGSVSGKSWLDHQTYGKLSIRKNEGWRMCTVYPRDRFYIRKGYDSKLIFQGSLLYTVTCFDGCVMALKVFKHF